MTLTATDTALGGTIGAAHGGLIVEWGAEDRWRASPKIPSQTVRSRAAVRSVLIYDPRPDARAALTLRVSTAVPSASDITCAARPADLIKAFSGRQAELVFIGVEHQTANGPDTATMFLRQYPTATVIVFGTLNDIPALTTAMARGAVGMMLWHPWHHHPRLPPPRQRVRCETPGYTVTRGERGILEGMSQGLSNREIGAHLDLSEETVKARSRVLYRKLGARDRAHAVALALRQQILT